MRILLSLLFVGILLWGQFVPLVFSAKIQHEGTVYRDAADLALNHPEGVACDKNSFVVADTANSRVVRYSVSIQGLKPEAVFPLPGTFPIIAQVNARSEVYLLDGKTRTILKIDKDGQMRGKVEPVGLPSAKNLTIRSFKLDKEGNIFLLDIFSERVVMLDETGGYLRQLSFPEGYRFFSDLAISPKGTIYLLDSVAGTIYAADPGTENFEVFSAGLKEHVNFPVSLAIDSKGTLYLSDQYGGGLALLGPDGNFQSRKFSMGWNAAQFYYPSQICINDQDMLVVADRNNSRVQVFNILDE